VIRRPNLETSKRLSVLRVVQRTAVVLLIALSFPKFAFAQTPSPLAEWMYSAGNLMRTSMSPSIPKWTTFAGLSADYGPRFDGSRDNHWQGGPSIDIRYRDIAFLSTGEGLGVNLLRDKNYRAGAALVFDLGRRADEADHTRGLGNLSAAPELKVFGEYMIFPVMLRADVRRAFGGHDGWVTDLSTYMPVYGNDKKNFFVFLGPSVSLADDRYMSRVFGVTPTQSAQSGYAQYTAHAGLKSVSLGSSVTWLITDHWLMNFLASGQRMLGDAAGSPLTLDRMQYGTAITVGYTF